jgi:hypothetical protein
MTDPYIQINGTKIEVFDNDLSAVKTIKQLDEVTLAGAEVLTNKTLTSPVINTGISGTGIAAGSDVTTGTNNVLIVTPKAIGDALVNTRLKSKIITATRDLTAASGDVSYTGLDFTPTSIQCICSITGNFTFSMGFADSGKASSVIFPTAAGVMNENSNRLIDVISGPGAEQYAVVKTFDANVGFTLTWTKGGSPTGTLNLKFLCFR